MSTTPEVMEFLKTFFAGHFSPKETIEELKAHKGSKAKGRVTRDSRFDDVQRRILRPDPFRIASNEWESFHRGMCTDNEIRERTGLDSSTPPIPEKRFCGEKQGFSRNVAHRESRTIESLVEPFDAIESGRCLGIDDRVYAQIVSSTPLRENSDRAVIEGCIPGKDVEHDTRVDEYWLHLRVRRRISSVERPASALPAYL